MTQAYQNMEKLIDDFFEGKTSNQEEEILYNYFALGHYPDHLEKYAPIFNTLKNELHRLPRQTTNIKPERRKKLMMLSSAVVIAAAVVFAAFTLPLFPSEAEQDPFAGSYIIVNGQKITDMEVIMPEIEKTLALAAEIKQEINAANEDILKQSQQYNYYLDSSEQ